MKNGILPTTLVALILCLSSFAVPKLTVAQTQKLAERKEMHGETDRTPYITYAEFRESAFGGRAASKKSTKVTLGDIVTVSFIDTVTRLLGEPKTFNRIPYSDGSTVRVDLNYDGLKMEYFKSAGKADFRLREMKITSPEWSLTVGEKELCPGMAVNQLSPPVRKSGYVYVARQGTARKAKRSGQLEITDTRTQIAFEIDEDSRTVKAIRFRQMI